MAMTPGNSNSIAMFIDTNVWLYATAAHSPFHVRALDAVDIAQDNEAIVVTSPQVLREYLAVGTRPNIIGARSSISDLLANVAAIRSRYRLVEATVAVVDQIASLLASTPTSHRRIHDANIFATMLIWNISHLLTHNTAGFAAYNHLITVVPMSPAQCCILIFMICRYGWRGADAVSISFPSFSDKGTPV